MSVIPEEARVVRYILMFVSIFIYIGRCAAEETLCDQATPAYANACKGEEKLTCFMEKFPQYAQYCPDKVGRAVSPTLKDAMIKEYKSKTGKDLVVKPD